MVMVPEWMAQSIQTKFRAETSPFISGLTEIEQEMSKVLTNKKLAEDRKIMLFNQLLLRYNDIMKQKRKEEVPMIRIAKEKQKKPPSKESDFVFVTPEPKRKKKKKSPSRIPVPTYETPKRRKTLTPRRRRLEDIPEFDGYDEDDSYHLKHPLIRLGLHLISKRIGSVPLFQEDLVDDGKNIRHLSFLKMFLMSN